jgi:hypothetical protein
MVLKNRPLQCRKKFLRFFPSGFRDPTYLDWERDYKWETHKRWQHELPVDEFRRLLHDQPAQVATRALRVEQQARHSMLFSFEKMALRDALKTSSGASAFASGLYAFLHGTAPFSQRFDTWTAVVAGLPRKQTRVFTWPVVTVFGFIAQPRDHLFLKPNTMRAAARAYGFPLRYTSRPSWDTYESLLAFADVIRHDLRDLKPRDMIDLQSFMWVLGSDEYA